MGIATESSLDRGDPPSISLFTDAAKYSYAALCSLALKQLYTEDVHHHQFSEGLICSVRKHLDLPDHTDEVMFALFRGEGVQNEDVYVDLVKQEGHAFSILIVRDLVYLAVKGGMRYLNKQWISTTPFYHDQFCIKIHVKKYCHVHNNNSLHFM